MRSVSTFVVRRMGTLLMLRKATVSSECVDFGVEVMVRATI